MAGTILIGHHQHIVQQLKVHRVEVIPAVVLGSGTFAVTGPRRLLPNF
jgi:hypothetical protein